MSDLIADFNLIVSRLQVAESKSDVLISLANELKLIGELMGAELDKLRSEVEENKTVIGSAVVLLNNLSERLRAVAGDATATSALADELDANNASLAAAVAANTPAATP